MIGGSVNRAGNVFAFRADLIPLTVLPGRQARDLHPLP